MRVSVQRDDAARLVVVKILDAVTADGVRATVDEQAASGTWSYAVLYDESDAPAVELAADDMRAIAAYAARLSRQHGPRGPVAIVAKTDVDYGTNRMASAYAGLAGYEIGVFRTVESARLWLATRHPRRD